MSVKLPFLHKFLRTFMSVMICNNYNINILFCKNAYVQKTCQNQKENALGLCSYPKQIVAKDKFSRVFILYIVSWNNN